MKNIIKNTVVNLIERAERNTQANTLLRLSDRQLEDIGLSRARLEKGAKAYPWKVTEVTPKALENLRSLQTQALNVTEKAQNDSGDHFDKPRAA